MKVAVAFKATEPLTVLDVPVPALGARDVLVRVTASGICRTDLSMVNGLTPLPLPMVPGHEGCGVVEAVGPEVRRVEVGDRVLASVTPACGTCWWCVNGLSNHCELNGAVKLAERYDVGDGLRAVAGCGCGTFAEAMVVDEASVVPVRTDLPDEQLALLSCGVTTGLGAALNTARVTPGSSVAVIGCGGVGQSVVQGARIAGAAVIVAIDPSAGRRTSAAGKRFSGSVVGDAQILRDFPRFICLAESGRLDLGSMVSNRITLDQINHGIALLDSAEGVRTVVRP